MERRHFTLAALALCCLLLGLAWRSSRPNILSLDTNETPQWQSLPTGSQEIRLKEPVTVSTDYMLSYSYMAKIDEKPSKSDVVHDRRGVTFTQPGFYHVHILERDSSGRINSTPLHKFNIIVGDWPSPFRPRRDRSLPDGVQMINA